MELSRRNIKKKGHHLLSGLNVQQSVQGFRAVKAARQIGRSCPSVCPLFWWLASYWSSSVRLGWTGVYNNINNALYLTVLSEKIQWQYNIKNARKMANSNRNNVLEPVSYTHLTLPTKLEV